MEWVLCLGHALLGALLLPVSFAPWATRRRALEVVSVAGVALGLALVAAGEAGAGAWRTAGFEPRYAAPAGLAAAAAWLVTGALAGRRARPADATLTGVAASGLVLASTGRYVVPALIFWVCSSAALAAPVQGRARWTWGVLAASDVAVSVAALVYVGAEGSWALPRSAGGAALAALVAAAVLRCGVHLGSPGAATAPLFTGGAMVLAARAGAARPWVALGLIAAALAWASLALARNRVGPAVVATWATAVALAASFAAPGLAPLAGAAAVLVTAVAALWPYTAGRGGVARGLAASLVPLTAGFGVVAGGAGEAFGRATAGRASATWALAAALLVVTLAAGVVLGGRAARADALEFVPEAVLATWLLLAALVVVAVLPQAVGDRAPLGDSGGVLALQLTALAAGAAAGVVARRSGEGFEPAYGALVAADHVAPELPRAAVWAATACGVATASATVWLTVAGLRVGFL